MSLKDDAYNARKGYNHIEYLCPRSRFTQQYKGENRNYKGCEIADHHCYSHANVLDGHGTEDITRHGCELVQDYKCFVLSGIVL